MAKIYGDDPSNINSPRVAVDTETTGLNYTDEMLGFSLAWRVGPDIKRCYIDLERRQAGLFSNGQPFDHTRELITNILATKQTVFHSASFDYRFLFKTFGVPVPMAVHDTMFIVRLVGQTPSRALVACYKQYVKKPLPQLYLDMKAKRASLATLDPEDVAWYGAADAVYTLELFEALVERLKMLVPPELYMRDMRFIRLVLGMIERGLNVDQAFLADKRQEMMDIMMNVQAKYPGLNPNSSDQVANYLIGVLGMTEKGFNKTPTGKISIDKEKLEEIAPLHPAAADILAFRECDHAVGSWIDQIVSYSAGDGSIHAQIDPFGTVSYRMSCNDINLQGIPMKDREAAFGSFKGAFVAHDPSRSLWSCDIKQAEVRLAGMLSRDQSIAEVFFTGEDPYVSMAKRVWNDPTRRNDAKRATLAGIYQIGTHTFARKHKVTVQEAEAVLSAFRSRFPGIKQASRYYENRVLSDHFVPLLFGHRRYFGPEEESYKAFNQHVQGSLAEFMDVVMLEINRTLPDRMRLQIHDSIVLEIDNDPTIREKELGLVATIVRESVPDKLRANIDIPMEIDTEIWE